MREEGRARRRLMSSRRRRVNALSLSLLYLSAAHSAAVADVQPAPGITPATTRTAGEGGVGDAAPAGAPRFLRDGMLLSHRRRTTLARSRLRRRLDPVVSAQVWADTRWRGSVRGAASHRVWEERHRVFWRDGKRKKTKDCVAARGRGLCTIHPIHPHLSLSHPPSPIKKEGRRRTRPHAIHPTHTSPTSTVKRT